MTEQSSEPTAEGLTEAERKSLQAAMRVQQAIAPDAEMVYAVVERILADRLAAVQADRDAAVERITHVVQLNTEKARHVRQLMARLAEVAEVAEERGNEVQEQKDRAESAEAERDAALAALDRVKALATNYAVRAQHWPEPRAQWTDIESDLRAAVEGGRS